MQHACFISQKMFQWFIFLRRKYYVTSKMFRNEYESRIDYFYIEKWTLKVSTSSVEWIFVT